MSHRVIAGTAKGRRLKFVPGNTTRPVTDRAKEALFSIIGYDILDTRLLDLFAGTGSIGIEALSRGAESVLFIDKERQAIQTIHENLKITGFTENALVRQTDALRLLTQNPPEPFHYIYIAPPQYLGLWKTSLQLVDQNIHWLTDNGVVIVQIDPKEYEEIELNELTPYDQRKYGRTLLVFYELTGAEDF
ncbi:16S rRNA (guanine(966)-N(2))-methyltransferase RsmD [Anaerolineales bacterium]